MNDVNEYVLEIASPWKKALKIIKCNDNLIFSEYIETEKYDQKYLNIIYSFVERTCNVSITDFLRALSDVGVLITPNQIQCYPYSIINCCDYNITIGKSFIRNEIFLSISKIRGGGYSDLTVLAGYIKILEIVKMLVALGVLKLIKGNDVNVYNQLHIANLSSLGTVDDEFEYSLE